MEDESMPLQIKEVHVNNLGPITEDINWELGQLNVVYGGNETGKTFLVEFLIQSLFKKSDWQLRQINGKGNVIVDGIDKEPIKFTPRSSKKIEDVYHSDGGWLPPKFSRLLVVKAAELALEKNQNTDKIFLKRYLSSKEILDQIQNNISKTIQKAEIQNQEIQGYRQGEIKKKLDLEEQLQHIDQLFDEINSQYLGGELQRYKEEKNQIEQQLAEQVKAKKYHAYQLSQRIIELENKQSEIDDELVDTLKTKVATFQSSEQELNEDKQNFEQKKNSAKHFPWVQNAKRIYDEHLQTQTTESKIHPGLFIGLFALLGMAGVFSLLELAIGVYGSLIGIGTLILYLIIQSKKITFNPAKKEELDKIKEEYQQRFETPLSTMADLQAKIEELNEPYNQAEVLKEGIEKKKDKLRQEEQLIRQMFTQLTGENIPKRDWNKKLKHIKTYTKELTDKITRGKQDLGILQVDESEYITIPVNEEYDASTYDSLITKNEEITSDIANIQTELNTLKSQIANETNKDISESWMNLIAALKEHRQNVQHEYDDIVSEILGKIAVMNVLDELSQHEDEKLKTYLQRDIITQPLKDMTQHYNSVHLDEDTLRIADDYSEYALNDLSTGVKDQIFLALRMGFCSKALKQDKVFFILDDAFQHSDWNRREHLVQKMVSLAEQGWQILYFTMDNHIRDLFNSYGGKLGDDYKFFEMQP
jgi:DNA repair exonuclease SbcCD ATPase subunit